MGARLRRCGFPLWTRERSLSHTGLQSPHLPRRLQRLGVVAQRLCAGYAGGSNREGIRPALGCLVGTHQIAYAVDLSELGEAGLWAPQRVPADGHALLNRVEEIVRRGRVRGLMKVIWSSPWMCVGSATSQPRKALSSTTPSTAGHRTVQRPQRSDVPCITA